MFLFWIVRIIILIIILAIITLLLRQRTANKKRQKEIPNLGQAITAFKRSTKSKALVIILNSLLVMVFMVSALCYRDVSQYAAKGGDPLGILFLYVVSFPCLLVLTLVLASLKNRLQLPLLNILIPIVGIPVLILPLLADIAIYPTIVGLLGVGMGVTLSIVTMATTVVILKPGKSKNGFSL